MLRLVTTKHCIRALSFLLVKAEDMKWFETEEAML